MALLTDRAMAPRELQSFLGYRQGDLIAAISSHRAQPVLTIKSAYITAVVDFWPDNDKVEMTDTTTFFLTTCTGCGDTYASRVRVKRRNSLHHPLNQEMNGATETAWDSDCVVCRDARLNRERVARYRERNPRQPLQVNCAHCGETFTPQRSTATFCTAKCRVAAHRAKP